MVEIKIKLPEGFLDEEERCGYQISSKMKQVWAIELDLLSELDRVCKKHNIQYFASGGTMLGAVRHKGFIPWDDDIDLMMMREEYDKLCAVAPSEFKHPYFFQTEYTDEGSLRGHAQIRNSMTTGILNAEQKYHYRFNQGIFIDIFPLDAVIDDAQLFEKQKRKAARYKFLYSKIAAITTRYSNADQKSFKGLTKKIAHDLFGKLAYAKFNPDKYYELFEKECKRYNDVKTELISTLSFQFANKQHFKYREDYEELIEVPFEFMTIPIGKNYDHALTKRYGNYQEFVVGGSCHGEVFFDVEESYQKYIS